MHQAQASPGHRSDRQSVALHEAALCCHSMLKLAPAVGVLLTLHPCSKQKTPTYLCAGLNVWVPTLFSKSSSTAATVTQLDGQQAAASHFNNPLVANLMRSSRWGWPAGFWDSSLLYFRPNELIGVMHGSTRGKPGHCLASRAHAIAFGGSGGI